MREQKRKTRYTYLCRYLHVHIIIKQRDEPVYIWRRGLTGFQGKIYNYKATEKYTTTKQQKRYTDQDGDQCERINTILRP